MIDISYVITVYNKAAYMEPMLNGLERQSGDFSREYIFVDDGSTDNSVDLIRERTKGWENVRIIQQENGGISVATNTGGFAAQGEFIKIVDADDVLTHYASRRMLEMMREHELDHLSAKWVLSDDVEADALKQDDDSGHVTIITDPLREFIKRGMAGSTSTMVRTSTFKEMGGADPEVFVQDVSIPLRVAARGKMASTDLLAVIGPRDVDGRMMGAHPTMVYTMSANMYHFLRDHPDVSVDLQRLAFKRCAGRAWKWAKREQGKGVLSKDFYLYLMAQLPIWSQTAPWIKETLHTWDKEEIRHPPKRG
ncbi:glycosyltransferase [Terasakiella sp. SH-1]|uniref:glycosyltransferase family 2 protein n=1 Tax=Terasakiella sp. SH-1 TaxID=2560057 RepID=UPI00107345F8|nr:glycosyltransferase [Terasakiella sp. SH-1]